MQKEIFEGRDWRGTLAFHGRVQLSGILRCWPDISTKRNLRQEWQFRFWELQGQFKVGPGDLVRCYLTNRK